MNSTILVAEDETDLLRSIKIVLTTEGYQVLTASNGRDALKLIQEKSPDLFITDVTMPHMTGLEVIHAVSSQGHHLKTIVMSAARADAPFSEDDWNKFLPKPFTIEQLMQAVKNSLAS